MTPFAKNDCFGDRLIQSYNFFLYILYEQVCLSDWSYDKNSRTIREVGFFQGIGNFFSKNREFPPRNLDSPRLSGIYFSRKSEFFPRGQQTILSVYYNELLSKLKQQGASKQGEAAFLEIRREKYTIS